MIDVAKHMRDDDVGAIPDRDIACRAVTHVGNISKLTAQDVMTKDVICCSPEDDLTMAIKIMEGKKIRRLPVTDAHKTMVGMLSLGDISHKASSDLSSEVLRAVSAHHR